MNDWLDHAACSGKPTSWWFPVRGDARLESQIAVAICRTCPVRRECLDDVLALEVGKPYRFGIVAGLTPDQRDRLDVRFEVA